VFAEALIREKANAAIVENQKATQKTITAIMLTGLQEQAAILEEESNNTRHSWEERIQITQQSLEKQVELLDFQLSHQLISQEDYQKEYLKIEQDTTDKVVELMLERQAALTAATEDRQDIGSNTLLLDLEKEFESGAIGLKDYLKEREGIVKQAKRNELQLELDFYKELQTIQEMNGINTLDTQRKISEIELEQAQDSNAKQIEGQKLLHDKLKELRTVGVDAALQIIDNLNQAEDERREARLAKIEENLEYDLTLAGDNEEKKLELKNKAKIEEDKIRKEQAAADRKRAIFQKALAVTNIGINTAQGIGVALSYGPPVGIVLAVVMAALGAIQLAAVLSKPIPSYAKGTKNHPGGPALVAEAGSEIIMEPGSAPYLQTEERIMDLPPHTQVIKHDETMQALALSGANRYDSRRVPDGYDMSRLEDGVARLNHTVKTKKEVHINFTKAGVEAMFEKAGSKLKFLNDFYA